MSNRALFQEPLRSHKGAAQLNITVAETNPGLAEYGVIACESDFISGPAKWRHGGGKTAGGGDAKWVCATPEPAHGAPRGPGAAPEDADASASAADAAHPRHRQASS